MRSLAAAFFVLLTAFPARAQPALWRARAAPVDADRIGRLGHAWDAALKEAHAADPAAIRALGPLASRTAALAQPLPPVGNYRCRTLKLGGDLGLGYVPYAWFRCRIERSPKGEVTLSKYTGSQRFFGVLYPDTARRLVFLGAGYYGYEAAPIPYRAMPDRDQAGVLERVEAGRWRVALPWPRYESKLDLIEIKR